jgi:mannitol/fructose-specific phosphotransferase system IIA component (Ntr-type)
MNHLLEILNDSNVIFNFQADTKDGAIEQMVDHLVNQGQLQIGKKSEILESLLLREKSMSTGIGSGVAIPHCSVNSVEHLKAVMAISPDGVNFDSIDSQPVHIFILLIVPKSKFQEHIKTLAIIAKTLNQSDEREKIIRATSLEEIKKVLVVV